MPYTLGESGGATVTLYPEADFRQQDEKIEDVVRARSSRRYVYKWSDFTVFEMNLRFMTQAETDTINGWWRTNTKLEFTRVGSGTTYDVCITNDDLPLGEFTVPYDDRYTGSLSLESY